MPMLIAALVFCTITTWLRMRWQSRTREATGELVRVLSIYLFVVYYGCNRAEYR